jgi:predicted transcriptional regulator
MSFVLRLPDELESRVRQRADAEHRTMHSLVLHAVERYVTETVSDEDFDRALAEAAPYALDVFAWHDQQQEATGDSTR